MNNRGQVFEDLLLTANLRIENNNAPTWIRGEQQGINNYICSQGITVSSFSILEDKDALHDHQFLFTTVENCSTPQKRGIFHTDPEQLLPEICALHINPPVLNTTAKIEGFVTTLTTLLQACISTASKEILVHTTRLHWWTPGLTALCNSLRNTARQLKQMWCPTTKEVLIVTQKILRTAYRKSIAMCRHKAFCNFVTQEKPGAQPTTPPRVRRTVNWHSSADQMAPNATCMRRVLNTCSR